MQGNTKKNNRTNKQNLSNKQTNNVRNYHTGKVIKENDGLTLYSTNDVTIIKEQITTFLVFLR